MRRCKSDAAARSFAPCPWRPQPDQWGAGFWQVMVRAMMRGNGGANEDWLEAQSNCSRLQQQLTPNHAAKRGTI